MASAGASAASAAAGGQSDSKTGASEEALGPTSIRPGSALARLPDNFFKRDGNVVSTEIANLDYPWNLPRLESRVAEYSSLSESISAQLTSRVMRNYNEFVQGMQQVQAVESELTSITVVVKNGRRSLKEHDAGLVAISRRVVKQRRKAERMRKLLQTLEELQSVVHVGTRMRECVEEDNFCEAVREGADLREALSRDSIKKFPGMLRLREGLSMQVASVQSKLSDGLKAAAVSSDFNADRYEEILRAYSMMPREQALAVGKELLRYVSECIVAVSRQCMLAFSAGPAADVPADWHKQAQLRDLCKVMHPTAFVPCIAQLYEHLCDFLYRHQFLSSWHSQRLEAAEQASPGSCSPELLEVFREVLNELSASKRNVWEKIQQQVSLVLMTLDFQFPALTEESFLHILHLTHLLIEEGDVFMADYQGGARSAGAHGSEGKRSFSAPVRNTLKSKAHDYFQSLSLSVLVDFKVVHLGQDSWQRLPVPRNFRLIRTDRLRSSLPRGGHSDIVKAAMADGTVPKIRGAQHNPFRNYKSEPMATAANDDDDVDVDDADVIDQHALLQHWIDDAGTMPSEQIGSAMLSNANRNPVVSTSTVELGRVLERYCRLMGSVPHLAEDIFTAVGEIVRFYIHCVWSLFVQEKHMRVFMQDLEEPVTAGDVQLYRQHECLLMQLICPDLRSATVRLRERLSTIKLPYDCAACPGGGNGTVLMNMQPLPKLGVSSAYWCIAERCVGVESVTCLLHDLSDLRQWLATLLPKGGTETVDRFFAAQEQVAAQLRAAVLMCAARDLLEAPDAVRLSLDQFSLNVQALQWDVKDFPQGSPAAAHIDQLRNQIRELARRLPCAGGGSIPFSTQQLLWGWVGVRIMQECCEIMSKCGKKKTPEALAVFKEDFKKLRAALDQEFKVTAAEGGAPPLLPSGHSQVDVVSWISADTYIEAHNLQYSEGLAWCKQHAKEYPLRLLRSLLEYLFGQRSSKTALAELEAFLSSFISEEFSTYSCL